MIINDTYIIEQLTPGSRVDITISGLGDTVAEIQFEDELGFHTIPEEYAISNGDTYAKTVTVSTKGNPKYPFARLRVKLSAPGTYALNWLSPSY
jgi:hypothetical protein